MEKNAHEQLVAAILTLSEGMDAMHEMMRKTLSFQVDLHATKIPDSFIPKPLDNTESRFLNWQQGFRNAAPPPENDRTDKGLG